MNDKQEELDEKSNEFDKALEALENKDETENDLSMLENELSEKEIELSNLESEIESKEDNLEKLENSIVKAEEEPIEISSGEWVVGSDADIPEGRYSASGSSNFVVRDEIGSLEVNTILGDSGDGDYVFFAFDGYTIRTNSKTTLTPVE